LYTRGAIKPRNPGEFEERILRSGIWQNNPELQFSIGDWYAQGVVGPTNLSEAVHWFTLAATNGHARAQNRIGELWRDGAGGNRDWAEAAIWFKQAAENGLPQAQFNLGHCFRLGEGLPKNEMEAFMWIDLAADQKFPPAMALRAQLLKDLQAHQVQAAGGARQIKEAYWKARRSER
jgi:TPR repeat protein